MSPTDRKKYVDKIKNEIERNKTKRILWVDFSLSQEQRDIIVQEFDKDYVVVTSPCFSCKGWDIYIESKKG